MRRLIWSPDAIEDLIAIRRYIRDFNPKAASKVATALLAAAGSLNTFPDRGRQVRPGVRELAIIRPYLIRYAVLDSEVRIIFVRHTARRPED